MSPLRSSTRSGAGCLILTLPAVALESLQNSIAHAYERLRNPFGSPSVPCTSTSPGHLLTHQPASDWEVRFSNSKQLPYFYNTSTKQSIWDPPSGLSAEEIQRLPGAEKLSGGGGKPAQVRASHLLIKHEGSRRASSWKEANITRSKDEALRILKEHLARLNEVPAEKLPEEFAKLASTESDCSSAKKGGDLGMFGPGQMQAPFEHATFALQPGAMSGVVDTDSGVHIILRTA